jgi:hypothetical protein
LKRQHSMSALGGVSRNFRVANGHHPKGSQNFNLLATPAGFEPATLSLEDDFMHNSRACLVVHEVFAFVRVFAPM